MSCTDNKAAARTAFGLASFASGSTPIQVYEQTQSTDNTATVSVTKGTISATLTFANSIFPTYVTGDGAVYLKISQQTDGSSNTPPVTASSPALFRKDTAQTVSLNNVFTSTTYADQYNGISDAPTFSGDNTCSVGTFIKGWSMTDSQVVMTRSIIKTAVPAYS